LYGDYELLTINNNLLHREWTDQEGRIFQQIVLPNEPHLEKKILESYHDKMAHCGVQKSKKLVRARYWWPNYASNVERYIKTCPTCQSMKKTGQKSRAPLEPEISSYIQLLAAEFGLPPFEKDKTGTYADKIYRNMAEAHTTDRITNGQSQARQKTNFDTKLFTNRFNERDWVWVANPEKGPDHPH
jgi:hypothetical protein